MPTPKTSFFSTKSSDVLILNIPLTRMALGKRAFSTPSPRLSGTLFRGQRGGGIGIGTGKVPVASARLMADRKNERVSAGVVYGRLQTDPQPYR